MPPAVLRWITRRGQVTGGRLEAILFRILCPLLALALTGFCSAPKAPLCPYCGRSLAAPVSAAPIAVIVENYVQARPLSGLNAACLVFEAPAEGGITRFLALYGHGQNVPLIGPVRSMRPYFVTLAKSLGAVLAHCGASTEAYALAERIGLAHLDEIRNGAGFWRDGTRRMPHNLYTNTDRLRAAAARLHLAGRTVPGQETPGMEPRGGWPAPYVTLPYSGAYRAGFVFEREKGSYVRTAPVQKQLEKDGAPIRAAAVAAIGVPMTVIDRVGRLRIDLGAADRCLLYQGGEVFEASWSAAAGRAHQVVDKEGHVLALAPGTHWFALIPGGRLPAPEASWQPRRLQKMP